MTVTDRLLAVWAAQIGATPDEVRAALADLVPAPAAPADPDPDAGEPTP